MQLQEGGISSMKMLLTQCIRGMITNVERSHRNGFQLLGGGSRVKGGFDPIRPAGDCDYFPNAESSRNLHLLRPTNSSEIPPLRNRKESRHSHRSVRSTHPPPYS